jgi:6-phosphogluconate dehydrogenase
MKQHIAVIGLGKMGQNIALHLLEQGIHVTVYNRTTSVADTFVKEIESYRSSYTQESEEFSIGTLISAQSIEQLVSSIPQPKIVLLMVKAGKPVDDVISQLVDAGMTEGDILIDAGNSFYEDSKKRYEQLFDKKISYIDCGTSGGLEGARYGACLMIGGDKERVEKLAWLWDALSGKSHDALETCECDTCEEKQDGLEYQHACMCGGNCGCGGHCGEHESIGHEHDCCDEECESSLGTWTYFGPSGAGHFVKMVHNGVEYGIDQAIGEGFHLLEQSPYQLNLADVADNWTQGSVVRGWLMELLADALKKDGKLKQYKGVIGGGETGNWTVETAKKLNVPQPILEQALKARKDSQTHPNFSGKVVSALRFEYGGHKE